MLLICFFSATPSYAQKLDTTLNLPLIDVVDSKRKVFSEGYKEKKALKNAFLMPHSSLSEVLLQNGLMYQKTYGMGSLATAGLRGGSATHTAILWNGFNISSPFNGLMDLALVPASLFSEITLGYGGGGDLWGTGSVAGSIHLLSDIELQRHFTTEISLGASSFGGWQQSVKLMTSNNKQAVEINILNQVAENNFKYYNPLIQNENTLTNATLQNRAVIANYKRVISKLWYVKIGLWLQQTKREIPPTYSQKNAFAFQEDKNVRGYLSLIGQIKGLELTARSAYFFENLYFQDEPINIFSENTSNKLINELNLSKNKGNHNFHFGINQTLEQGRSGNYMGSVVQQIPSFFGGYKTSLFSKKLNLNSNFRQSFFNGKAVPFVYGIGFKYRPIQKLEFLGNHARVFRIPALNDRFWVPGGNLNLLPEQGFTNELTIGINDLNILENIKIAHQSTLFSRVLQNWIIWLPSGSLWMPQNLLEVWSRGLETHTEFAFHQRKSQVKLWVNTNYILSSNQKAKSPNDASVNKQLIYAPMYQGAGGISFEHKNIRVYTQMQYTGYTYTTSDHSNFLEPFWLVQLGISGNFLLAKHQFIISGLVQNLTNTNYQVVANRPMPPRNFSVTISYKITKP